jgi:hypothetical protein
MNFHHFIQFGTLWWSYRNTTGIDILFLNTTNRTFEIRFNPGYKGKVDNSIGLGSKLDEVMEVHGGALMMEDVGYVLPDPGTLEKNRALYTVKGYGDSIISRIFFVEKMGILYWFDPYDIVVQIVVFSP